MARQPSPKISPLISTPERRKGRVPSRQQRPGAGDVGIGREARAVDRPDAVTVPPPLATDQVKAGALARAAPNWSRAVAVNCCLVAVFTVAVPGLTVMLVSVWLTVTATSLVVLSVPSEMVTRRV